MLRKPVLFILMYFGNLLCFAQEAAELPFYQMKRPNVSGEKISLETDRHFYCINEKLFFRVDYKFNNHMEGISWSNVLYVELIRWNGEKIVQAKYKLNDNGFSGSLIIPNTVLSGNYYLRAYTKWMRNFLVEDYTYKMIKVFNPFESNIDDGESNESDKEVIYLNQAKNEDFRDIICFTDKNSYKQRDKIDLTLLSDKTIPDGSGFCISVTKTGIIDTNSYYIQIPEKSLYNENNLTFLPEFRGISISGRIVNANSQIPIPNILLNLSLAKECKYYSSFQTNSNGLFYFTLPEFYGIYDFYLDAANDSDEITEIQIDQDFCNRSIQLNYIPFTLNENEKEVAQEMMINMQLANIYNDSSRISIADSTNLPFFGRPERVYYTKDYIKLPNLEEFVFEILKEVRIVHRKKQTFLKFAELNYFQNLDPLILIDNVPVQNGSDFIKMPLDKIKRIEIINKPYIVSSKRYNGVICIITENEDLAGVKLNNNSLFFSYSLFSDGSFIAPEYSSNQNSRVADRRNLLLWYPYFELKSNQPKKLSFYSSDSKGEYIVYIRSLNDDGIHRIYGTCRFKVE